MKKITFLLLLFFTIAKIQAQDYQITFAGKGASTVIDSVKVENLTQCKDTWLIGSNTLHLTGTVGISGINDINQKANNALRIYPSPMTDHCVIEFEATTQGTTTIELYNISGKRIIQEQTMLTKGIHTFQLSGINSGVYILNIISDTYSYSDKIISTNTQTATAQITYNGASSNTENINFTSNTKSIKKSKGENSLIEMQYTTGDLLKFTGYSGGIHSTIMQVPTQTQTDTFNFVHCNGASITVKSGGKIQDAINLLYNTGGTINVEQGVYIENIHLFSCIKLQSSQQYGAVIKPANTNKYTITGYGKTDISVLNFAIEGGVEFGQVTTDFSQISERIVIQGNKISNNENKDGIHIGGAESVEILNNEISNSVTEQGIDLVGVKDFTVTGNIVHDILNSSGMGIVAKAGSVNGTISNNEIYNCGNAAIACGQVSDEVWILPEGIAEKYEAKNMIISKNYIHDNSKFSLYARGATNSKFDSNTLGLSNYYAIIFIGNSDATHSPAWTSRNITINQIGITSLNIDLAKDASNIILNGVKLQ